MIAGKGGKGEVEKKGELREEQERHASITCSVEEEEVT